VTSGRFLRHPFQTLTALALLLAALPAAAQWSGKGEAGVALASGNTNSNTANAKIAVARKSDAWENSGTLVALYVRNSGVTTARRWELGGQTRFNYNEGRSFWYGGARYEEDRFSGFEHQGVVNSGLGHRFIDNDTTKFSGQAGVGFKFWETLDSAEPRVLDTNPSNIVGVARVDFEHKLVESTTAFNHFSAEFTSHSNFLQNELGIIVKMTDRFALAVSWALRHNTQPPEGFAKTDTLTTVNLVYEVK
jgi:putative salt-induced outer membrane protein